MSKPERHNVFETAQLRALAFLFATLLLLGIGKAFEPDPFPTPQQAAVAFQAHAKACTAALLANGLPSVPGTPRFIPTPGSAGPIISFLSNQLQSTVLAGQIAHAFVFIPNAKRCILFSCQRMGDPPVFSV
ncbi:MAG: hypothetical protein KDD10_04815 [Phaeodactylibacter sp.]|nr:hypothetical protein [Phaeodactylibacter sp.]